MTMNIGHPTYDLGTTGDEAVMSMIRDLFADRSDGHTRRLVLAMHHLDGGAVLESVAVGWGTIEGEKVLRWCVQGPMGVGSSSVFHSGDPRNHDPAACAVRVGMDAARRCANLHPLKDKTKTPWVFYLAQFQQ